MPWWLGPFRILFGKRERRVCFAANYGQPTRTDPMFPCQTNARPETNYRCGWREKIRAAVRIAGTAVVSAYRNWTVSRPLCMRECRSYINPLMLGFVQKCGEKKRETHTQKNTKMPINWSQDISQYSALLSCGCTLYKRQIADSFRLLKTPEILLKRLPYDTRKAHKLWD